MNNSRLENMIIDKYKLTDKELKNVKNTIISVVKKDIIPSKSPLAIIVAGQSGAGKTGLINYTTLMSKKREFVVLDNDFFRAFHPMSEEIKEHYPNFYTSATDQIGLQLASDIIEHFINESKYDIIIHQTLKNNRLPDDAMVKLRNNGYTIGVRAYAVSYFESKMSQIERCEGQIEKLGYCRYVRAKDHDTAIEGMPNAINYIEEKGKYDFLEIFKRGEKISEPTLVYSRINPATKHQTLSALADCEKVSLKNNTFGFDNAKDAILTTREDEIANNYEQIEERIILAENNPANNDEIQSHIDELKIRLLDYKITHSLIPDGSQPDSSQNEDVTKVEEEVIGTK